MTNSELLLLDRYVEEITKKMRRIDFTTLHPLTGSRLLKCPVCGKQPMNANELKKHFEEMNDDAHILHEVMNS